MTDFSNVLSSIRRPKTLIRAARMGVVDYRRERDLKRILRSAGTPSGPNALVILLAEEQRLEENRTNGNGNYSAQRHVLVLTAVIAEARAIPSVRNNVTPINRLAA